MINDKIAIVQVPDYAHSSDYKICLVGDTLINDILHILDKDKRNISEPIVLLKMIKILLGLQIQSILSNFVFVDNQNKIG